MSNIVNLDRDMFWLSGLAPVASVTSSIDNPTASVGNNGIVGQRHSGVACVPASRGASATDEASTFGCLILPPPDGDVVPYRVKGAAVSQDYMISWHVGYFTGGTGIAARDILSSGQVIDDVFAIRPLQSGDPNFGFPLMFFCAVHRSVDTFIMGGISVQRLISKPDQYASAVS